WIWDYELCVVRIGNGKTKMEARAMWEQLWKSENLGTIAHRIKQLWFSGTRVSGQTTALAIKDHSIYVCWTMPLLV
uniref:Uncharacterized protein n=1 Tax=Capitella teleta TaxID=283909 RepID=X2B6M3_CAPTE